MQRLSLRTLWLAAVVTGALTLVAGWLWLHHAGASPQAEVTSVLQK